MVLQFHVVGKLFVYWNRVELSVDVELVFRQTCLLHLIESCLALGTRWNRIQKETYCVVIKALP